MFHYLPVIAKDCQTLKVNCRTSGPYARSPVVMMAVDMSRSFLGNSIVTSKLSVNWHLKRMKITSRRNNFYSKTDLIKTHLVSMCILLRNRNMTMYMARMAVKGAVTTRNTTGRQDDDTVIVQRW